MKLILSIYHDPKHKGHHIWEWALAETDGEVEPLITYQKETMPRLLNLQRISTVILPIKMQVTGAIV